MIKIFFSLFLVFFSFPAFAITLEGEISFNVKPPIVSLVYFNEITPSNSEPTFIDQKNKQFTKKMVVLSKDSKIMFKNSDAFEHNIYVTLDDNKVFDIGLASPGAKKVEKIVWSDGYVAKVSCKIHPEMISWIASVNSKYYSIIEFDKEKKKKFVISDIPENLSTLSIWFPKYEKIELDLKKGQSKVLEIKNKDTKKIIGEVKLSIN